MLLEFNFEGKNFGVKILFQFFLKFMFEKIVYIVKNKNF